MLSAADNTAKSLDLMGKAPVIPVLVINDLAHARPLAEALVAGGLPVLEVTLRTPQALEAIKIMSEVAGGIVGAGTVLNADDAAAARAAGAQFAVSPGCTDALLQGCADQDLPLLAGATTASEIMSLIEKGYFTGKFFPAEAIGGAPALKALAGPLPQMNFCPTGGITAKTAGDYLALSNVKCVGGSWVTPKGLLDAGDWAGVEALAKAAAGL